MPLSNNDRSKHTVVNSLSKISHNSDFGSVHLFRQKKTRRVARGHNASKIKSQESGANLNTEDTEFKYNNRLYNRNKTAVTLPTEHTRTSQCCNIRS